MATKLSKTVRVQAVANHQPSLLVYAGLLVFVALIPFESSFLGLEDKEFSIMRPLGIALFGLWTISLVIAWRRPVFPTPLKIGVLFAVWAALSVTWAIDKEVAGQNLSTCVQLLALAVLIVNEIRGPGRFAGLLIALFLGCAGVSVMGLLGIGTASDSWLLTLEGQGAKEYGAYVGVAFLLSGLMFVFGPASTKPVAAGAALVTLVPLLASGERGVLLALALSCVAIIPFSRQKFNALLAPVVILGVLYFALPLLSTRGRISTDIADRFTIESVLSTGGSGRTDIWKVGLSIIRANPLFGVGLGNFESVVGYYAALVPTGTVVFSGRGPHADWLEVASGLGIAGFSLFVAMLTSSGMGLVRLLRRGMPPRDQLLPLLGMCLFVYVVSLGLTSTFVWRKVYWLAVAIAITCPLLRASAPSPEIPTSNSEWGESPRGATTGDKVLRQRPGRRITRQRWSKPGRQLGDKNNQV